MAHGIDLMPTLAGGLGVALFFGYITQRIGLSPIVGYLLAGIAVGPHTPGFVADEGVAAQLAHVGVVLLMFGVGLHFHVEDLLAVRGVAVPGAVVQSLVATALGGVLGWAVGWGWIAGIVYGLALSVASTVVLTRVLADNNDLHTPSGHVAVGWLVVEDLFTVVILVLLPALFPVPPAGGANPAFLFATGGAGAVALGGPMEAAAAPSLAYALVLAGMKIAAFVAIVALVGGRVIPWVLTHVAATRSRELFTLTVLVVALGIAVGATTYFGVSMELGAFLAGMVVGRSAFGLRAAAEALPMRDAFAVLFFVSVGMLFDPAALFSSPGAILGTAAVVLLGKPIAALLIVLVLGYPLRVGVAVAVALAQVGEFSFILAEVGARQGVLPMEARSPLVAVAIFSIAINPLLYRLVGPVEAWLARRPHLWRWLARREAPALASGGHHPDADEAHRAVVVGYGPVGRTVCRLLRDNGVVPTVVELNLETVTRLNDEGTRAVYGDAGHRETLEAAGVARAATLILSSSGLSAASEVIRLARELNPDIRVLVRAAYLRERPGLREAGADEVYTGEGEVALAMTEAVLRDLGAIPEQIDRERDRVRADLFGKAE